MRSFYFLLTTIHVTLFTCLCPLPLSSAVHLYHSTHRPRYCREYYAKRQVKDFVLIYAWPRVTLLEAWGIAACVVDYAEKHGQPYGLGAAVAMVESRFNRNVINHMNCYGHMQVRPFDNSGRDVNLKELIAHGLVTRATDLLQPEKNFDAGYYLLAKYRRLYPDLPTALSRYSGSTKPINKKYVEDVFAAMEYFEG